MASPEPERLSRGERVYFVSDVHLTPGRPDVFVSFCRFLEEVVAGARALYVLGDLFDFWMGKRQARLPGYEEVFSRTRALKESGTSLFFIPGNRDFMLDGAFAGAQGFRVLPDISEAVLGDKRVAITHGDLLCTRDAAYHRMRKVIRSGAARAVVSALPLPVALRLARGFRSASGAEIRRKASYILDPDFSEARRWLDRGCDALIFGHVHTGEHYRVALGDRTAEIFVLGSWEDAPNYVEWSDCELSLVRYPTVK